MGPPPPYHHEGQHVLSQRCMGGGSTTHWHRGMNALWPAAGKPRSTDLDHTCQSDRIAGKFGDLVISDLDFRLPLCHQNCQLASYIAGHVAAFWLAGCMGWQVFIVITWTGSTSLLDKGYIGGKVVLCYHPNLYRCQWQRTSIFTASWTADTSNLGGFMEEITFSSTATQQKL